MRKRGFQMCFFVASMHLLYMIALSMCSQGFGQGLAARQCCDGMAEGLARSFKALSKSDLYSR